MGNWNGIWKAQAPHKARHLLWHLCRGCLPTRSRLLERRVECTLNCPVCDEEIEDELHIFFRCAIARDSWSAAGLSSVLHNATYQQTYAMNRIFAICGNESSDTVVHKLQSNNVSGTTEADLVRWEKPTLDWVKCNVDVAFVSGSGRTSMGLCFRDNSGHFMAGMTQWQQTVISSVEGETWGLLLAMEEARYRGLDRVQFESDSKVLIEFVRRQANLVAHTLARAANSWASFHRFENILFCIERLVFNEMQKQKRNIMCPICWQKAELRQKIYLKAEKKRKKKEARQNERKRKREEAAEKVKKDQEPCQKLNLSPVDISQVPQIDKQIEVAKKGNVESAKEELPHEKKPKLFKENVESTKEMLPTKIRNFKFNLDEASVGSLKKYLNELVLAKMRKVERGDKAKNEEY
ncbi:hypothetical protein TSUD_352540 [Trifolium subterraneum]|nr:hypothetical protein TSUD_352540 [Trifolium subterraneum]